MAMTRGSGGGGQQRADGGRGRVEHVLAVVDDEQGSRVGRRVPERGEVRVAELAGHGLADPVLVVDLREVDGDRAEGEPGPLLVGDDPGQGGLADAAGTADGDEAPLGQAGHDLIDLGFPADQLHV